MAGKGRSKRSILQAISDPGFIPPDTWSHASVARAEATRVKRNALVACIAWETPRRLGESATSTDLAADKYLSKGIAYSYFQLWKRLTTAKNAPLPLEDLGEDEQHLAPPGDWRLLRNRAELDADAKRFGRTVIWDQWWKELRPRLAARQKAIATYVIRSEQPLGWGYRIVAGISSEIDWIDTKFDHCMLRYYTYHDMPDTEAG